MIYVHVVMQILAMQCIHVTIIDIYIFASVIVNSLTFAYHEINPSPQWSFNLFLNTYGDCNSEPTTEYIILYK